MQLKCAGIDTSSLKNKFNFTHYVSLEQYKNKCLIHFINESTTIYKP